MILCILGEYLYITMCKQITKCHIHVFACKYTFLGVKTWSITSRHQESQASIKKNKRALATTSNHQGSQVSIKNHEWALGIKGEHRGCSFLKMLKEDAYGRCSMTMLNEDARWGCSLVDDGHGWCSPLMLLRSKIPKAPTWHFVIDWKLGHHVYGLIIDVSSPSELGISMLSYK